MNRVEFELLSENAYAPIKASEGAGGYDLVASRVEYQDSGYVICYTDIAMDLGGLKALLIPRSSLSKYNWTLANNVGLLDTDYRGGIQFRFRALPRYIHEGDASFGNTKISDSPSPFPYKEGDRIGQIVLLPEVSATFSHVDSLEDSNRGEGGFGSTGN